MSPRVSSPAMYRFEDRILFVVVPSIFLTLIMLISLSHFHVHPTRVWAVLCAIFVSSPVIAYILILGLYLSEEKDEFQRALLVQSILWGLGVTACAAFFWMVLGMYIQVPHMSFVSAVFLFFLVFTVSIWVTRWRYR